MKFAPHVDAPQKLSARNISTAANAATSPAARRSATQSPAATAADCAIPMAMYAASEWPMIAVIPARR